MPVAMGGIAVDAHVQLLEDRIAAGRAGMQHGPIDVLPVCEEHALSHGINEIVRQDALQFVAVVRCMSAMRFRAQ
jgi:hypothetical protein